ncbi:MAG: SH3 domain-containing protein [Clostridium sp.]
MASTNNEEQIEIIKSLIDINYTKAIKIKPRFIVVHGIKERIFKSPKHYRDYIATNEDAKQSVHFIVGKDEIIQVLEEHSRALHVGDRPSKIVTNSNSIAIALYIKDDMEEVVDKAIQLVNFLKEKYNIDLKNIQRHYDVTGKMCPEKLIDEEVWNTFKGRISGAIVSNNTAKAKGKIISVLSKLKIRKEPSNDSQTIGVILRDEEFFIYDILDEWVKIIKEEDNNMVVGYLSKGYVDIEKIKNKEVKISIVEEKQNKTLPKKTNVTPKSTPPVVSGTRAVIRTLERVKINNKVGRVINVDINLNVRRGPGLEHFVIAYLLSDELVVVVERIGDWYKIIFNSTIGKRIGFVEVENITIENA